MWALPRVQPCEPCISSNFFHRLWIELRFCMCKVITSMTVGKILLAKTNRFFHEKSSLFLPNFIHMSSPTCHSTCPLPQRVLLSKRTSRLYESLLNACAAPFLRKQSDFAYFEVSNSQENAIFRDFPACETCHGCNHANLGRAQTFSTAYGLSWGFACAKL